MNVLDKNFKRPSHDEWLGRFFMMNEVGENGNNA